MHFLCYSAAQIVQLLVGIGIFCSFTLQFFVCLEIVWNGIKDNFKKKATLVNYSLRTFMVFACVAVAIAVPTIGPFIGLIGALCFSILGLLIPIFIEIVTFWDKGFGKYNWKIYKNIIVILTGVLALIFGSKSAIADIIDMYVNPEVNNATRLVNVTDILSTAYTNITTEGYTTAL